MYYSPAPLLGTTDGRYHFRVKSNAEGREYRQQEKTGGSGERKEMQRALTFELYPHVFIRHPYFSQLLDIWPVRDLENKSSCILMGIRKLQHAVILWRRWV